MDVRKKETQHVISLGCAIVLAIITGIVGSTFSYVLICAYCYYNYIFKCIVQKIVAIYVEHKSMKRFDIMETISSTSFMLALFMIATMRKTILSFNIEIREIFVFISLVLFMISYLSLYYSIYLKKKETKKDPKN